MNHRKNRKRTTLPLNEFALAQLVVAVPIEFPDDLRRSFLRRDVAFRRWIASNSVANHLQQFVPIEQSVAGLVPPEPKRRESFSSRRTHMSKRNDRRASKFVTRLVRTTMTKNSLKSISPSPFTSIRSNSRVASSFRGKFAAYEMNCDLFS